MSQVAALLKAAEHQIARRLDGHRCVTGSGPGPGLVAATDNRNMTTPVARARYLEVEAAVRGVLGPGVVCTHQDGRGPARWPAHRWRSPIGKILLVNNSTDTRWCQVRLGRAAAICFPRGRLAWLDPSRVPVQGQAVLYFGRDPDRFRARFESIGVVFGSAFDDEPAPPDELGRDRVLRIAVASREESGRPSPPGPRRNKA